MTVPLKVAPPPGPKKAHLEVLEELRRMLHEEGVHSLLIIATQPEGQAVLISVRHGIIEALGMLERAKTLIQDDEPFDPIPTA